MRVVSTQQYTRYSKFVEPGVNSDNSVQDNYDLDMSCVLHTRCRFNMQPLQPDLFSYSRTKPNTIHLKANSQFIKETDKSQYRSCSCSVTSRLPRPVAFIKLDFAFRYYVYTCCGQPYSVLLSHIKNSTLQSIYHFCGFSNSQRWNQAFSSLQDIPFTAEYTPQSQHSLSARLQNSHLTTPYQLDT